jgi:hypothetical protein
MKGAKCCARLPIKSGILAQNALESGLGSEQKHFREISGGLCTNLYIRQLIFEPDRANNEDK